MGVAFNRNSGFRILGFGAEPYDCPPAVGLLNRAEKGQLGVLGKSYSQSEPIRLGSTMLTTGRSGHALS